MCSRTTRRKYIFVDGSLWFHASTNGAMCGGARTRHASTFQSATYVPHAATAVQTSVGATAPSEPRASSSTTNDSSRRAGRLLASSQAWWQRSGIASAGAGTLRAGMSHALCTIAHAPKMIGQSLRPRWKTSDRRRRANPMLSRRYNGRSSGTSLGAAKIAKTKGLCKKRGVTPMGRRPRQPPQPTN